MPSAKKQRNEKSDGARVITSKISFEDIITSASIYD